MPTKPSDRRPEDRDQGTPHERSDQNDHRAVEGCEIYVGVEAIACKYGKEAWIQIENANITRTSYV